MWINQKTKSKIAAALALVFPALVLVPSYFIWRASDYIDTAVLVIFLVFLAISLVPLLYFLFGITYGLRFYSYGLVKYTLFSSKKYAYADISTVSYERRRPFPMEREDYLRPWYYFYEITFKNGNTLNLGSDAYMNRHKFHERMLFWLENLV